MPVLVRLLVLVVPLALAIGCTGNEAGSPTPGDEGGSGGTGGGTPDVGALHGTVLLVDGAPAVGATVTLPGRDAVVVGPDGAFAFDLLPPGSHDLAFSLAPYRAEARAVAVEAGGDTEVAPVVLQRVIEVEGDRLYSEAARSFGGSRLLFCAGRDEEREVTDAWLWDDAGVSRRLATALDDSLCYRYDGPAFSPDDRFLLFPLARPLGEDEEWILVEPATGETRSLGVRWSHEFWPDSSRLIWTERADGEPASLRTLTLPGLEETVLCERSGGIQAIASDRGGLVCGAEVEGAGDYYPDLLRWDLASMTSSPLAADARIVGITPDLDRALLLVGDDAVNRSGLLFRRGEEPVSLPGGVGWDGASCDEGVERGFLLANGELFGLDLVAGTAVSIDTGVDRMEPSSSHEQVFYYKGLVDDVGRLFTWDERSRTSRELADGVRAGQYDPFNDWPRAAAFIRNANADSWSVGELHLYRFDGRPPRLLATRANVEQIGPAGLAFFHDVDETWTGSLSILAAGAEVATPLFTGLRYREESSRVPPRISAGMDRVLATEIEPETGTPRTWLWSRAHGATSAPGVLAESMSGSFERVLLFAPDRADPSGLGALRLYDFTTGALVTLGERTGRFAQHDDALTRVAFTERTDAGGERLLRLYDHASGETRTLLEDAANAVLRPNPAFTHALIWVGLGAVNDGYLADLGSGRVDRVALGASWSEEVRSPDGNQVLIVEVGYDAVPTSGRLLLLDLPAMTATVLDEATAPEAPWVDDDFSAIVYRRDVVDPSPQNARDTVGELWARALRPGAVAYPVDRQVRGVVLGTAGSFLYEVEGEGIRAGEWPR